MVPQSNLQGNKWNTCFHQTPRPNERLPIPIHRARGMRIHELAPATPVALQRSRLFLAQVESSSSLPTGEHVKGLSGKSVEGLHLPFCIHIAPQQIQTRQQVLTILQ